MKRILIMLTVFTIIYSCNNGDDLITPEEEQIANEMTLNGVTSDIKTVYLETHSYVPTSTSTELYVIVVEFFTVEIDSLTLFQWINRESDYYMFLDGATMFSCDFNFEVSGIGYDITQETCYDGTYSTKIMDICTNMDAVNLTYEEYEIPITSFCIDKTDDDIFTIEFECSDDDGNEFSGYYNGKVYDVRTSE